MRRLSWIIVLTLLVAVPLSAWGQQIEDESPEAYQDERRDTPEHHQHHPDAEDEQPVPEFARNEVSGYSRLDDNPFPLPHMMDDDPFWMVRVNELETRQSDGETAAAWDAQAWWGTDLHRIFFKTEAEREDSDFEALELQLLYSRAISPFWNLQAGLRHDLELDSRQWLALSLEGLAPYWFESEASLFFTDGGQAELRLETEYELLLTQRLILSPEIELSLFAEDEPELGIGSGLSKAELGLRLRYEIQREFAPYIGLNYERRFGDSADFAELEAESDSDLSVVAGVRFWF